MAATQNKPSLQQIAAPNMSEATKQGVEPPSETLTNGLSAPSTGQANGNEDVYEKWGFHVDELYKIALTFFKEKEGSRALHTSYKEKLGLVVLTKQVAFGPYRPELMPDVGFFDVVGNDRKLAWQKLGDMLKEAAMEEFITGLSTLCPLFTAYVEAHKAEREEQERRKREEDVQKQREELERLHIHDVTQQQDLDKHRQVSQEVLIRNALNQQTYVQFRQYAEQQCPGDQAQQESLIRQLQEQHFVQYMQQVYQQQHMMQQQYLQQQQEQQPPAVAASASTTPVKQSQQLPSAGLSAAGPAAAGPAAVGPAGAAIPAAAVAYNLASTTSISRTQNIPVVSGNVGSLGPGPWRKEDLKDQRESSEERGSGGEEERTLGDGQPEDDADPNDLPPIAAASMWTRKDLREFKDSLTKDPDSIIKVGSGELVTVRVPTHEDGSCLFWEFASDSYDIGFGVFFEWSVPSANELSVHVSESSEDEEEEGGKRRTDLPGDGKHLTENDPPTDEIIPVYRRDCQDEVYCGSHVYPGRGVYLLKFDNSYSLWRGKTVYYRVYYTR